MTQQHSSIASSQDLLAQVVALQQEVQKLRSEKELMQTAMTFSDEVTDELYSTVEVSQRESAEQVAANRAKSAFLAHMSHELRTPLNTILGFVQLMAQNPAFPANHHEHLRLINQSGQHLLELINDILELSRIEVGEAALVEAGFDLYHILDYVRGMMQVRAEKKGLHLDFERAASVPRYVKTDELKLRQVLINLLDNAIKFTEKGSVTLQISVKDEGERMPGQERSQRDKNNETDLHPLPLAGQDVILCISISDTGPGITPEEIDQIFKAFTQAESGRKAGRGVGLGLALSREFVRLLGGAIAVSSRVGRGSIFTFDIRVELFNPSEIVATETGIPSKSMVGLAPGQPDYRILIVDDDPTNRELLRTWLKEVGFTLREASNGQQALDIALSWQPHLIWMDMRMPEMDGREATRRIKAQTGDSTPVIIALTAGVYEDERLAALAAGCDDFVRKPFRAAHIFDTMTLHLGVRYVYTQPDKPSENQPALTPADLVNLPAGWLDNLHQATTRARPKLVLDLVAQIEADHPRLARTLTEMVREYRFKDILDLTEHALQ